MIPPVMIIINLHYTISKFKILYLFIIFIYLPDIDKINSKLYYLYMKKKIINLIIIVSFVLMMVSFGFLITKNKNIKNLKEEHSVIDTTIKELNIYQELSGEKEILKYKSEFNNNDILAILKISDIINIPIVQTKDNLFYLKYGLNKKKVPGGAVFLDYRTSVNDKQLNIYGHNSTTYDIPFKKLENYLNNDFTKQNDIIYLKTIKDIRIYQIFAVSITSKTSRTEHYNFEYNDLEDWKKHFERLKKDSIYKNNISLLENDEIIVLQTCLFKKYNNKLLVISAKKIK